MGIKEKIEEYSGHAIELRRELHRDPEVSRKEFHTTDRIRRELEEYGIEILHTELETGLIAEIHGKKPGKEMTVAVRADIDALPVKEETGLPFASANEGVCHSCGHDLHMATVLLAARVLKEMEGEFCGTVRLLFQPAEESGSGAKMILEQDVMKRRPPDLVLGLHTWPDIPEGSIGFRFGSSHASSDTVIIRVIGKGGHGAHPYRCVDPVIVSAYLLTQLQTLISRELPMTEAGVLTFGMIRGGSAPNVIPGEVEIQGTLRTLNPKWRESIIQSIKRVAHSCCEAMRAEAKVQIAEGMPVLVNSTEVIEGVRRAAVEILGAEHVEELTSASPGSDDFSCYLANTPGALFRIGTGTDDPASHIGLHNGRNLFGEKAIAAGAAVIVQYLLDILTE
ncbi:MAG: M20 family metallopeptidase [Clostridiales bacterium]|nr:M20 family metallopeptidase [Clostridiales bacterium]